MIFFVDMPLGGEETRLKLGRTEPLIQRAFLPLQVVVHVTEDLLSRASMTVVNGRPTLTINIATAREHWLEGMLRHEIGTQRNSGGYLTSYRLCGAGLSCFRCLVQVH